MYDVLVTTRALCVCVCVCVSPLLGSWGILFYFILFYFILFYFILFFRVKIQYVEYCNSHVACEVGVYREVITRGSSAGKRGCTIGQRQGDIYDKVECPGSRVV